MEKIWNLARKSIIGCLGIFIVIIFCYSLVESNGIRFNENDIGPYVINGIIAIVVLMIFIGMKRIIEKVSSSKVKYIKIAIIVFIVIGQIFVISSIKSVQVKDAFFVQDSALSIINNNSGISDNSNGYFSRYSNNNFCLVLTVLLFKLFIKISLDSTLGFAIFNTIMIDLGILFSYLLCKKIGNNRMECKMLLFHALNPITYLFIYWFYTNTYSIPFMVLIMYLAVLIKKSFGNVKKEIVLSIAMGACIAIAYLLRPVIIIPLIACVICVLISLLLKKLKLKEILVPVIIIFICFITTFYSVNKIMDKYIKTSETSFPATHWIMMGLTGDGTYNDESVKLTSSYKTKQEMQSANIKEIKRILKDYKITGFVTHLAIKLPITWSNGVSAYSGKISQGNNQNDTYIWLVSEKNDFVKIYSQAFRIVTLLLCLIGIYSLRKNKKIDIYFLNNLTILGAIMFYLLWEAKTDYSIPFLAYLFILAIKRT